MRLAVVLLPVLALGGMALAQPVAIPSGTGRIALQPRPAPDLPEDSRPSDFLRAAAATLATGRYGETAEALEMAQTRMLDRSVPLFQTNNPSDNPTSQQITQARQALAARDRAGCMELIQVAIASATAQGF